MAPIQTVEAIPVAIDLTEPMHLASETIKQALNLVVKVVDADGVVGWGEAASAPTMTGETLPGMVRAVRDIIGPSLLAVPADDYDSVATVLCSIPGNSGARSAVDIAVLDIFAQRARQPLNEFLGTKRHTILPRIQMINSCAGDAQLAKAGALAEAGFTHFKVKVGQADASLEAAFVRNLRNILGPDPLICADANMAWDVETARQFIAGCDGCDLAYLEQPLGDGCVEDMARLAKSTPVALCLDEGLHAVSDIARYDEVDAAKGVGLKLIKLGGFRETLIAESVARQRGWQTTYASKIAETSIGCAATAHVASLSDNVGWGVSLTHQYLVNDIAATPLVSHGGRTIVPTADGLGVQPDEKRLNSFRLDL